MSGTPTRKHFLDWLRVIAFVLLIVFHTGLLYSSWHYNLKSPRIFPEVEWALLSLTPWRLALLFFVSGVASRHLLDKLGAGAFAFDRVRRLLPVILVGMFIVIPPQTYVELVGKGVLTTGYVEFWFEMYLAADQTLVAPLGKTMPTWDHLWFIVYLLAYLLVAVFVSPIARFLRLHNWLALPLAVIVLTPLVWLVAAQIMIELYAPLTHAFANDWGGHLKWSGMFLAGFVCALRADFWDWCQRERVTLLGLAAVALGAQTGVRALWLQGGAGPILDAASWSLTSSVYAWMMICCLCGYAARYLDKPSFALSHLNEAVLPVYVLHQPILLVTAWWTFPLRLPLAAEACLLLAAALLGSVAIYETLIRPCAFMRALFGLKPRQWRDGLDARTSS